MRKLQSRKCHCQPEALRREPKHRACEGEAKERADDALETALKTAAPITALVQNEDGCRNDPIGALEIERSSH
jgi:hypothetical protein